MVEVETLLLFGDSHYDSGSFDHGTEEQKEALAYYEEAFNLLMKMYQESKTYILILDLESEIFRS